MTSKETKQTPLKGKIVSLHSTLWLFPHKSIHSQISRAGLYEYWISIYLQSWLERNWKTWNSRLLRAPSHLRYFKCAAALRYVASCFHADIGCFLGGLFFTSSTWTIKQYPLPDFFIHLIIWIFPSHQYGINFIVTWQFQCF